MREHTNNHTSHPTSTSTPSGRHNPPGPEVPTERMFDQGDSPPVGPPLPPDDSRDGPLMDAALSGQFPGTPRAHCPNESPDELLTGLGGDVPIEDGLGPVPSHDVSDGRQPGGAGHDSTVEDEVEVAPDSIRVSNVILTRGIRWEDPPDDLECADEDAERIIKQQWTDASNRLREYRPNKPRNAEMLARHYEVVERLVCDATIAHEYPLARTLSYLLAYIAWLDDNGYPVTEDSILNRTNIEAAAGEFAGEYMPSTVRTIRSCLTRLVWELGGDMKPLGGIWRGKRTDPRSPYSDTEVGWLGVWAETQGPSTALTTARMSLVLGLGAGGEPGESMNVRTSDIAVTSSGVVVTFPKGRKVTVRKEFEDLAIETLPLLSPGWVLMPRTKSRIAPLLYNFMNWNADDRAGFLISMRRMRMTWLIRHLAEGLPLDVLIASADLDGTSGLSRYLPFFPKRSAAEVARLLRGEDKP